MKLAIIKRIKKPICRHEQMKRAKSFDDSFGQGSAPFLVNQPVRPNESKLAVEHLFVKQYSFIPFQNIDSVAIDYCCTQWSLLSASALCFRLRFHFIELRIRLLPSNGSKVGLGYTHDQKHSVRQAENRPTNNWSTNEISLQLLIIDLERIFIVCRYVNRQCAPILLRSRVEKQKLWKDSLVFILMDGNSFTFNSFCVECIFDRLAVYWFS